ncbi:MAG: patatin-like phospholipase family protein, partial [Gammaproteobacteria bacterium]|nr:patatin-like phospholipase family protein [Gammaproteobacteria bacterium]NNJ71840.1 patatin-like phospholipase family protein [Enterobacterales bacterium]
MHNIPKSAIVLSGGGARAAYQVGALKAVYECVPKGNLHPFPIICGSSAGAINAASIACYAGQFRAGIRRLESIWANLTVEQVFRGDLTGMLKQTMGFIWHVMSGHNPSRLNALLDNSPLRELLTKSIPFKRLDKLIDDGILQALCISCSDYYSGDTYSFYQGHTKLT